MGINPREIDNAILAILAILAMFGTNAKDCNDCYDCGLRVWKKRNLWDHRPGPSCSTMGYLITSMLVNPREIFNGMIGMIGRIGRIGQCTMIPMIPMIPLLHSGRIGNDWGNEMLNFQREPATQPGGLGASREAPNHWTKRPMLPLPKCLISQCFSQRARLAMTGFLPCSILAEKAKLLKTKEL
jgi:hypothetical protein